MKELKYSMVLMDGNESFKKTNPGEWYWIQIDTVDDAGNFGVTVIGPCIRRDAEKYIERVVHSKKRGFWSRLFCNE